MDKPLLLLRRGPRTPILWAVFLQPVWSALWMSATCQGSLQDIVLWRPNALATCLRREHSVSPTDGAWTQEVHTYRTADGRKVQPGHTCPNVTKSRCGCPDGSLERSTVMIWGYSFHQVRREVDSQEKKTHGPSAFKSYIHVQKNYR
jgi:hypothetical protein